jgi:hypothetical protein
MPNQPCPGYSKKVASDTAWDFASEADEASTIAKAQENADNKAAQSALRASTQNLCTPPCITIPNIRFTRRRSKVLHTPKEHPFFLAVAFTVWELDILCINPLPVTSPAPSVGPAPPTFPLPTVPPETAPVHGGSKTRKRRRS